jgi:hypothetical protein
MVYNALSYTGLPYLATASHLEAAASQAKMMSSAITMFFFLKHRNNFDMFACAGFLLRIGVLRSIEMVGSSASNGVDVTCHGRSSDM